MTFPLQLIGRNWKAEEQTRKGTAWLGKEITCPSPLKERITHQIILCSWGHCFFCPSVSHRPHSAYNGLTHMLPFPYERLDTARESSSPRDSSQKKYHTPLVKTLSLETVYRKLIWKQNIPRLRFLPVPRRPWCIYTPVVSDASQCNDAQWCCCHSPAKKGHLTASTGTVPDISSICRSWRTQQIPLAQTWTGQCSTCGSRVTMAAQHNPGKE